MLWSHAWRGCTVCHVKFVHGDLEGEKSQGPFTDKKDHCSTIRTGFVLGLSRSRFQSPTTVRLSISHSPLKPRTAQGTTRLSRRCRWVAAQKPPQQHLAGENPACWRDPEYNSGCSGFRHQMNGRVDLKFWERFVTKNSPSS